MEKQNRAERRRNKFGGGRATEHGGWPTHLPNPAFGADLTDASAAEKAPAEASADVRPSAQESVAGDEGTESRNSSKS
jgi:hypothetical protein